MMRLVVRLFFAFVFFVLGCAITLAIVWAAHKAEGRTTAPSVLWLVGPLLTFLGGWRYGGQVDIEGIVARMGRRQRLVVGFSALWVSVCIVVFSAFDPFGKYRWDVAEWTKFLIIMCGPIVVGFLAGRVSRWANAGEAP